MRTKLVSSFIVVAVVAAAGAVYGKPVDTKDKKIKDSTITLPEPATLTLAALGIGAAGALALRSFRRK